MLHVGQAVRLAYRSKFSKRRFTQPQTLVILCLMRDEDCTFREAEVRLAEHRERRAALGLHRAPDYTTPYRFLRRLDEAVLEQSLRAVVQRLLHRPSPLTTVSVDATRLTFGVVSTFCVKRVKDREPGVIWRHRLQWTMAVDLDCHMSLARTAQCNPTNDGAILRPLVCAAHERAPIGLVLADAEFDSERNHQHLRHVVQAYSVIPAKRGATQWKTQGMRAQMRQEFPAHLSRWWSLIESPISAVKRQRPARAPGRSRATQDL